MKYILFSLGGIAILAIGFAIGNQMAKKKMMAKLYAAGVRQLPDGSFYIVQGTTTTETTDSAGNAVTDSSTALNTNTTLNQNSPNATPMKGLL